MPIWSWGLPKIMTLCLRERLIKDQLKKKKKPWDALAGSVSRAMCHVGGRAYLKRKSLGEKEKTLTKVSDGKIEDGGGGSPLHDQGYLQKIRPISLHILT